MQYLLPLGPIYVARRTSVLRTPSNEFERNNNPTDPSTILGLLAQEMGQFNVFQESLATIFKALKLCKGRSGKSTYLLYYKQFYFRDSPGRSLHFFFGNCLILTQFFCIHPKLNALQRTKNNCFLKLYGCE